MNLYIKCETDYVNGVQLFEAIVESKIIETTQKQIENLKKEASKIISETKKASEPVKQVPAPIVIVDASSSIPKPITTTSDIISTDVPVPAPAPEQPANEPDISVANSPLPYSTNQITETSK